MTVSYKQVKEKGPQRTPATFQQVLGPQGDLIPRTDSAKLGVSSTTKRFYRRRQREPLETMQPMPSFCEGENRQEKVT